MPKIMGLHRLPPGRHRWGWRVQCLIGERLEDETGRRGSTAQVGEGRLVDRSLRWPAFVEPALRTIQGDPFAARAIVVAAPGAVGKSTFARTLGAVTSSVLVDLARTSSAATSSWAASPTRSGSRL
jgi:hypothetical protein